jgi:hypothetical protein
MIVCHNSHADSLMESITGQCGQQAAEPPPFEMMLAVEAEGDGANGA